MDRRDIFLWLFVIIPMFSVINAIIGAMVLAWFDTEDAVFYKWSSESPLPGGHFIVLSIWPIMVFFMIKYRKDAGLPLFTYLSRDES